MNKVWIRKWVEEDLQDIRDHILIVGELSSDCGKCREIGLDFKKLDKCPQCGTAFKYVTSRVASIGSGDRFAVFRKICSKRPELIFIDYDDYKKLTSRSKAEEFLRGD
jgi:hypothetical protein